MHHSGVQVVGPFGVGYKTGSLQETDHYIWNTADALGRGATAVVYFGRNKMTGDICAVKVFHEKISQQLNNTRLREIETLRSLQHDNIVKLLALESEKTSGNEVLVMEYCSGGSLYNMLEKPQYAFGFPESEFLLFLKDIVQLLGVQLIYMFKKLQQADAVKHGLFKANGMEFIRSKEYIHRDIKPGNIMRFIAEDGRSLYKITDFGTARVLQDDETFMSIYGTEEYLYPRMYEQAVLKRPGAQQFDASVDVWSLGVTIYHVATGELPFQPYGGRNNAATMHIITSEKPSGAISGTQHSLNARIEWGYTLPKTCQLSEYLQRRLVQMLKGLMEINVRQMCTFEDFFQNVNEIMNMMVFTIFNCCTCQDTMLYVHADDNLVNIQEAIAAQMDISCNDHLILYNDTNLMNIIEPHVAVKSYPKSVLRTRLYLFSKASMEICSLKIETPPKFPNISSYENVEVDAQMSKRASAIAYHLCATVKDLLDQQSFILEGERLLRCFIKNVLRLSEIIVPELRKTLQQTVRRQDSFYTSFHLMLDLFDTLVDGVEQHIWAKLGTNVQIRDTMQQLREFVQDDSLKQFQDKISTRLSEVEVYVEVLSHRIKEQETERCKLKLSCAEEDYCLLKAENLKEKIAAISAIMSKHRKYGKLHSHEQFIHKCEKDKLQEHFISMWSLAQDHCRTNLMHCFQSCTKEMSNLTKHLTRTKKVEQNITSVKENLTHLTDKLQQEENRCTHIVKKITDLTNSILTKKPVAGSLKVMQESYRHGDADGKEEHYSKQEKIRSELLPEYEMPETSDSLGKDGASHPKRQRTLLLDKLTKELLALKTDSEYLKELVVENSEVMKRFLSETSNLRIEGSLDSDQRQYTTDVP